MLRIVANGTQLVLDQKTSVSIIKQTQYFWLREQSSFGYNHTVPICPVNNVALNFAYKLHRDEFFNETYSIQYYWKSVLIFSGSMKINKTTNTDYELISGLDDADFWVKTKDKTLRDYQYGGRWYFEAEEYDHFLREILTKGTDTTFDVFHIFNVKNKFLVDTNGEGSNGLAHMQNNLFPRGDGSSASDVNEIFPDSGGMYEDITIDPIDFFNGPIVLSPFLKLNWVIENFFNEIGYTVNINFFQSLSETRRTVIYHNRNISGLFSLGDDEFWITPNELLPKLKIIEFIKSLEYYWGVTFWINSVTKEVNISPVVDDFTKKEVIEFSQMVTEKYEKRNDLISRSACLRLDVTNLSDIARPNKMPSPPIPIIEVAGTGSVGSPIEGQVVLVTGDGYWLYKKVSEYPDDFNWVKYLPDESDNTTNYFNEYCTSDTEDLVLESKCSHPMQKHQAVLSVGWLASMPYVNVPVMGPWEGDDDFGFQLMIYEGIAIALDDLLGDIDGRYPYGRVDLKNVRNYIYTGISLKLNNDEQLEGSGMVANFLGPYLSLITRSSIPVTRWKYITPEELNKLDFINKYRIDQVNYIIHQAKINLTQNRISICELSLIKTL